MFLRNRVVPEDAELVGEHRFLGGRRNTGPIELRTQQRPSAARQVAPIRCRPPRGRPRSALAVSCDAGAMTCKSAGKPVSVASCARIVPTTVPGATVDCKIVRRETQLGEHLVGPIAGVAVDHLARRGDRRLDRHLAAEPVVDQVRHEEQPIGRCERARIGELRARRASRAC